MLGNFGFSLLEVKNGIMSRVNVPNANNDLNDTDVTSDEKKFGTFWLFSDV
jgi:hypothetical protein